MGFNPVGEHKVRCEMQITHLTKISLRYWHKYYTKVPCDILVAQNSQEKKRSKKLTHVKAKVSERSKKSIRGKTNKFTHVHSRDKTKKIVGQRLHLYTNVLRV